MVITIVSAICLGSLGGIIYVVGKKISRLSDLPSVPPDFKGYLLNAKIGKLILSPEVFLQTLLSKIRIFALRIEGKTGEWLARLRKKSQEKNNHKFSDNYWDKLKK